MRMCIESGRAYIIKTGILTIVFHTKQQHPASRLRQDNVRGDQVAFRQRFEINLEFDRQDFATRQQLFHAHKFLQN